MSILTRNNLCKLLIWLVLGTLIQCSTRHANTPPDIPTEDFRSADIAFRLGRTLQSEAIASHGEGGYSHVGIIIIADSTKLVVHIEPNRHTSELIKVERLEDFFHPDQALAGRVMRHKSLNDSLRQTISDYTTTLLHSHISFDHDYRLSDSTRMYCTELLERIFLRANISLSQGKTVRLPLAKEPVIMPSAIYENDSLTTIWSYRLE